MRVTRHRRRCFVLAAAVAPLFAAGSSAHAGGNFDGGQVAAVRDWTNPINWDFDVAPGPADPIFFTECGDGSVDLNAGIYSQPSLGFTSWVSYSLFNGTFGMGAFGGGTIDVRASVSSTYGSDYFADGTTLGNALDMGGAAAVNTILFSHTDTGTLRISGAMSGMGSLNLMRVAGGSNNRAVYLDDPNAAYGGAVTINAGTSARLLCTPFGADGRTGTGRITINGGEFHVLSDLAFIPPPPPPFTLDQFVTNPITVSSGTIRADHNYTLAATPAFGPGVQHILGSPGGPTIPGGPGASITVDNPTMLGGTNNASVTFTADNGFNFGTYNLVLGNFPPVAAVGTRTVIVENGARREGYAGSVLRTSTNRLEEQVVVTQVGPGGVLPALYDFNPATGAGIPLIKSGTGVLQIGGDNTTPIPIYGGAPASQGTKTVNGGILRFMMGTSYGLTGGLASPVTLAGIPALPGTPVSAAMGVGYDPGAMPGNLITTGGIPGQSGAYDIDVVGYASAFVPTRVPPVAPAGGTALRLGSSGAGSTTGPIAVYPPTATYYFGGGGGTLTVSPGPALAVGGATVQMGTTGTLLPGRVRFERPVATGGPVMIEAGTLQVAPGFPGVLGATAFTAVGSYSTTLGINGAYAGAPGGAGGSFDGPGQLLLSSADHTGGFYFYGPGGAFGAAGVSLDGGAIGYDGPVGLGPLMATLPAQYNVIGAPMPSTLYQSVNAVPAAVATSILHVGGEYSAGTMLVPLGLPVTNNGALGVPVALLKSGNGSILDLTANPGNPYTGGTAILGGEIQVNMAGQLGGPGAGAVVVSDGGILHVVPGGPPVVGFTQILRVANGPERRSSMVNVDAGVIASFSAANLEAGAVGSVLEKTGGGFLDILPPFLYPSTSPGNTWGIKATSSTVTINQLPGIATSANGVAAFDGGRLSMVAPAFAIPAARQWSASNGFGALESYAGTSSSLAIADSVMFRTTGAATSSLMGALDVSMGGPKSIFKVGQDAAGDDTRGTGSINFSGGNVQFNPGAGDILWPRDGAFTMSLNFDAQFSGMPLADMTGNLLFNSIAGSPECTIDGATVTNGPIPVAAPSVWTIEGTGLTSWAGLVVKGATEAIPGSGGPFVTGTVTMNRCVGAPVSIAPGASLYIARGTFNAGGTGDPFTDTTTAVNLPVVNDATFNITEGFKNVASIGGSGTTTVSPGAFLDVGSLGPVTQGTLTVNGAMDAGNVNVSGTTTVGASPASLVVSYLRGGTLSIGGGNVQIKQDGGPGGVCNITTVSIPSGLMDLVDNHLVTASALGTWAGANYDGITGLIQSGRGTGVWDGTTGITTTMTDATTSVLTSLGVATGAEVKGLTPGTTDLWAGQTVTDTSTLVMYTWGGDADLDGDLDGDDYFWIDSNILASQASPGDPLYLGWHQGDFDYDGDLDGDDYFTIDSNILFAQANLPFYTSAGAGGALAAVPEPASAVMIMAMAIPLARRRRR